MDRTTCIIYFTCGALLGACLGVVLWSHLLLGTPHAWLLIPVTACLMGSLSAIFGEPFWESAIKWFPWI